MLEEFLALLEDVAEYHELNGQGFLDGVYRGGGNGSSHARDVLDQPQGTGCRGDRMNVADDQLYLVEVGGGLDDGRHLVDVQTVKEDTVVRLDVGVANQLALQMLRAVWVERFDEDHTRVHRLLSHLCNYACASV